MAAKSPTKKAVTSKKAAPASKPPAKQAAAGKPAAKKSPAAKPAATKAATPAAKQVAKPASKRTAKPTGGKAATSAPGRAAIVKPVIAKPAADAAVHDGQLPKPKFSKDGLGYTKDFDLGFIKAQYELLQQERIHLTGQAKRLEDEAHQLVEEAEMGDVQFDDEGGEGDTMVVERERDLALSAQARDAVAEIDAALERIAAGTYGYSAMSGRPIPKERLEAIPWSSVLVEEKVGGIGRR
jgi:RNA polymerase-binding transcription factor DksA